VRGTIHCGRDYREIIADNLSKAGFSWGCSSEIDSTGRVIVTADAYSAMVAGLLCWQTKDSLHFWNYRRRFIVNLIE
jgi:hypothetical protein